MYNQFLYTPPKGKGTMHKFLIYDTTLAKKKVAKMFNSLCMIDFYIPCLWGKIHKFLINDV